MVSKKPLGRTPKVNYRVMVRLADAIQHNTNITDACRYAGISRQTYYHYLNSEALFAATMATAKDNRDKLVMSFLTVW